MASPFSSVRQRREERAQAQDRAETRSRDYLGLRASAARMQIGNKKVLRSQITMRQDWQDEAWDYFDDIGEIKYTARLAGNVMSKLRFFVAVRPPDNPEGDPIPATDEGSGIPIALAQRAEAELERLKSSSGGRAELVRSLHINLEVAGECYLVCIGPRATETADKLTGIIYEELTPESWEIKSVDEVRMEGDVVKVVKSPGDTQGIKLDAERGDACIRIWERHPRYSYLPDNAMRGVLGICESVVLLENQVKAIAKSHASAGFFTLPSELELIKDPSLPPEGDGQDEEDGGSFLEAYHDALGEPIENPSSAASVAPLPLTGPAEFLKPEYVRHISLARPDDASLDGRIEGRILRVARGLNYPVETVLGHQATTFANAAQVSEDKFKEHYEPRAGLMCDAWTVGFLQPNLIEAGEQPDLVNELFVWYDASAIIRPPEPSQSAKEGWEFGTISDEAWRRVNGWTDDDAPTDEERLVRALLRMGRVDPGMPTSILNMLEGVPTIGGYYGTDGMYDGLPEGAAPGSDPVPAETTDSADQAAAALFPLPGTAPTSLAAALILALRYYRAGQQTPAPIQARIAAARTPQALRAAKRAQRGAAYGQALASIDRDLRTKLQTAAHGAMHRTMERAGIRLKSKAPAALNRKKASLVTREMISSVHPRFAAATLGATLIESLSLSVDDLISADAWDALHEQWNAWVPEAQAKALAIIGNIVQLSTDQRLHIEQRNARHADEAWTWLAQELDQLAEKRLYQPEPVDPGKGEFDPTTTVPVGLIRQALARAGGATGLETPKPTLRAGTTTTDRDTWVVLNNGEPAGGVALGEEMMGTLESEGAGVEAWMWDYGPAFRKSPFEDHEALDGIQFVDFESDELDAGGSWVDTAYFFPGDHDGCCCDIVPIIVGADGVVFDEASGDALFSDQGDSEDAFVTLPDSTPDAVEADAADDVLAPVDEPQPETETKPKRKEQR